MCDKPKFVSPALQRRNTLISHVRKQGWRLAHFDSDGLHFVCRFIGCQTRICVPLDTSPSKVQPCSASHLSKYGGNALLEYKALVAQLVTRRKALGLSQEDTNACTGLADGHINKLEAFHRFGRFETIKLWAETLGLTFALDPVAFPESTRELIDRGTQ